MRKLMVVFTSLVLLSCGNERTHSTDVVLTPPEPDETNNEMSIHESLQAPSASSIYITDLLPDKPVGVEKKIIKEGEISFETDNPAETRKQLLIQLEKLDGYIVEDREYFIHEYQKDYQLDIRIPAKNFDVFLNTATKTAVKVDKKDIEVKDVTDQYIDITSRLDNKKALEKRYLGLLDRADKMSDVLEIEAKITEIRTDIESIQGRLNYMNTQIAYSSLSIRYYIKQDVPITENTFGYKFKSAVKGGTDLLQNLLFGFILWWPLWIILLVIIILLRRWRSRRKK